MTGSSRSSRGKLGRAAALAAVSGLRSQLPLALLAVAGNRGTFAAGAGFPLSQFRRRIALVGFAFAAAGEMIVDKTPFVPSRLEPGPLAGRVALGGLVGGAVCGEAGSSAVVGALLGVVGAAAGSFAGYRARAYLDRVTGLPDIIWALAEDGVALGMGLAALARSS